MIRFLIGALAAAAIAIAIGFWWHQQNEADHLRQQAAVAQLGDDLAKARSENDQLKAALAKVQDEENRLAADNQALSKALEQARLAGKVPGKLSLPYPPK